MRPAAFRHATNTTPPATSETKPAPATTALPSPATNETRKPVSTTSRPASTIRTPRRSSQDPYHGEIGTPPSLHRYLYAYANPTVYLDPDGYESLSTMIDNGAEGCGTFSCAGWAALKGAYNVGTLGFAFVHDPVKDAYDEGRINGKQYPVGFVGGTVVAGVNVAATVMTAGTGTSVTAAAGNAVMSRLVNGRRRAVQSVSQTTP
jgi:hypothetical protein